MVWLASHMAFEAAGEAFERIARRVLPVSAIWDETQRHGERLKRYLDQQQAAVGVERVVLPLPLVPTRMQAAFGPAKKAASAASTGPRGTYRSGWKGRWLLKKRSVCWREQAPTSAQVGALGPASMTRFSI